MSGGRVRGAHNDDDGGREMSTRLSARLGTRLAELGMDVDLEHHGDPHVAFVVLAYPDREPEIVAVTERTQQSLRQLKFADDDQPDREHRGRFFTVEDFRLAQEALHDAEFGFMVARRDPQETLGEQLQRRMREGWERRIASRIASELARADAEARRPATCPTCGRRFTARGIYTHWARSPRCAHPEGVA